MDLRLRRLDADDEQQARAAHAELAADGFAFLLFRDPDETWTAYLAELAALRHTATLPADRVRSEFLVAEVDGVIVGRTSIRFALNEWLAEYGGHIGYGVRPAFRRRGYATALLRASLDLARDDGLERVLIVCDDANAGSAATIERCGGVFERYAVGDGGHGSGSQRRYWITL